jgi:HSP20 family protein
MAVNPFRPRFTGLLNKRRAHAVTLLEKGEVPMLTMTRWTPWTELAGVHRDLDSLFNRVFGDTVHSRSVDGFSPAADLRRDGDTWKVSLALPGVSPDKVDIDIAGRTLRVRGERIPEEKAEAVINEITYGRFEREFTLPEEMDAQHVQATYRHGMLELVLPLAEGAKPHRIAVKAAPEGKQLHAA